MSKPLNVHQYCIQESVNQAAIYIKVGLFIPPAIKALHTLFEVMKKVYASYMEILKKKILKKIL